MPPDILVGIKQIAARLGVSTRTVQRWHERGKLPGAYKPGGQTSPLRIDARKLDRLSKARGK